jgi:hypothetical protein
MTEVFPSPLVLMLLLHSWSDKTWILCAVLIK